MISVRQSRLVLFIGEFLLDLYSYVDIYIKILTTIPEFQQLIDIYFKLKKLWETISQPQWLVTQSTQGYQI